MHINNDVLRRFEAPLTMQLLHYYPTLTDAS